MKVSRRGSGAGGQGVERGPGRLTVLNGGLNQRVDGPPWGRAGHRHGDHARGQVPRAQSRQDGEADAGVDERDRGRVVLGLDPERRREAGRLARLQEVAPAPAVGEVVVDPGLGGQRGQFDLRRSASRWWRAMTATYGSSSRWRTRTPGPGSKSSCSTMIWMSARSPALAGRSSRRTRFSRRCGNWCSSSRTTVGIQADPTEAKYAIDSPPARPARRSATSDSTSPSRLSTPSISSARASPAAVGSMPRPLRVTSVRPGLALQRRDVLAHRRGRVAEIDGRRLDRSAGDDGPEHTQPMDVQHGARYYSATEE